MIKNYLVIAWRSFLRQKEYSFLNIAGLSIGLTCCIIILLYVIHERSFDRFHSKADRIFRVVQKLPAGKGWAWTGGMMPSVVSAEFKEVEKVVSLHCATSWNAKRANAKTYTYVTYEKDRQQALSFEESKIFYADADFFDVFDFPIVKGELGNSLTESGKVLITESMAKKYFGVEEPVGKVLKFGTVPVTVTGVLKDIPSNSHIQLDFLSSFATFKAMENLPANTQFTSHWWPVVWTYVLLDNPESANKINAEFPSVMKKYRSAEEAKLFTPVLQPLTDIHLHSNLSNEISPNGSAANVYIFLSVAICTVLLACINFMNLATARAVKRAKEIGIRKSIGGQRKQIAIQFFYESAMLNAAAFVLAIVLTELILPAVNRLLHQNLSLFTDNLTWWGICTALVVASTILSGFYPALYLSGFRPSAVLKGVAVQTSGANLRKGLVVFQFVLSVTLVFCMAIAWFQVQYMKDRNLGFNKKQVVAIRTGPSVAEHYDVLKNALEQDKDIENVTGASALPGVNAGWGPQVEFEGYNPNDHPYIFQQFVDYNFFNIMDMPLIAGRGFSKEFSDEGKGELIRGQFPIYAGRNFIINETAASFMGKNPEAVIGMPLRLFTEDNGELFSETKGIIIGVVKDFHTTDLHSPIKPTVFSPLRSNLGTEVAFTLVKIAPDNFSRTLSSIQNSWKQINGQAAFEYSFLDENIDKQYWEDKQLGDVVGIFAVITLFISCLGLFGLSAYTTESRTKEIGVRKVLGASAGSIIRMLSQEYIRLVLIAIVVALPIGWWAMTTWLSQFPYHMEIQAWIFIAVSSLATFVALATVSYQSVRAAHINPVDALRAE